MEISRFSPNGTFWAVCGTDGHLRIWETATCKLWQEFIPSSHLSANCTCLDWAPMHQDMMQVGKKRIVGDIIALGTAVGSLLFYDVSKSQVASHSNPKKSGSASVINGVTWSSFTFSVYTCGDDGFVREWDPENSSITSQWIVGKESLTTIQSINTNLLVAGQSIHLWDLNSKTMTATFTGHSGQIHQIEIIPTTDYFVSMSHGDRNLQIWQIAQPNSVATLVIPEPPSTCLVSTSDNGTAFIAVTTKEGTLYVFQHKLNEHTKEHLVPRSTVTIVDIVKSTYDSKVVIVPVLSGFLSGLSTVTVLTAYGNWLELRFEKFEISSLQGKTFLNREFSHQTIIKSKSKSKKKGIGENSVLVDGDHVEVSNDVKHLQPRTEALNKVPATKGKKRKHDNGATIPTDERKVPKLFIRIPPPKGRRATTPDVFKGNPGQPLRWDKRSRKFVSNMVTRHTFQRPKINIGRVGARTNKRSKRAKSTSGGRGRSRGSANTAIAEDDVSYTNETSTSRKKLKRGPRSKTRIIANGGIPVSSFVGDGNDVAVELEDIGYLLDGRETLKGSELSSLMGRDAVIDKTERASSSNTLLNSEKSEKKRMIETSDAAADSTSVKKKTEDKVTTKSKPLASLKSSTTASGTKKRGRKKNNSRGDDSDYEVSKGTNKRSPKRGNASLCCPQCGRYFARTDNLQEHMRIHTGETPFKCENCGKAYGFRASLAYHHKKCRRTVRVVASDNENVGPVPQKVWSVGDLAYSKSLFNFTACTISYVWGITKYHLQAKADESNLEALQMAVVKYSKRAPAITRVPSINDIVFAPYENEYYRAKVTSVDQPGGTINVLFIDCGGERKVKLTDCREPLDELMSRHPIYGVVFSLTLDVDLPESMKKASLRDTIKTASINTLLYKTIDEQLNDHFTGKLHIHELTMNKMVTNIINKASPASTTVAAPPPIKSESAGKLLLAGDKTWSDLANEAIKSQGK